MKRFFAAILFLSIVFSFLGCNFENIDLTPEYEFRQGVDQIQSIEILEKEYVSVRTDTPMYVLKSFDSSQFQMIIDKINEITIIKRFNSSASGFGYYIIRITYKNGEIDLLGNYNTGYYTTDGKLHQESFFLNDEQYYELLSELLGEEIN